MVSFYIKYIYIPGKYFLIHLKTNMAPPRILANTNKAIYIIYRYVSCLYKPHNIYCTYLQGILIYRGYYCTCILVLSVIEGYISANGTCLFQRKCLSIMEQVDIITAVL